jgi:hypothetical protein
MFSLVTVGHTGWRNECKVLSATGDLSNAVFNWVVAFLPENQVHVVGHARRISQ